MRGAAGPPARILEQVTAQQAHVAGRQRRLAAADRSVRRAIGAESVARARRRADAALMDLEAAESLLGRLLLQHAVTCAAGSPSAAHRPAAGGRPGMSIRQPMESPGN